MCYTWSLQIRGKTQFFPRVKLHSNARRCLGRGTAAASCLGTALKYYPFSASQRSPLPGFVEPGASYGLLETQNTLPASRSVSGKPILKKQNKGNRPKIRLRSSLEESLALLVTFIAQTLQQKFPVGSCSPAAGAAGAGTGTGLRADLPGCH